MSVLPILIGGDWRRGQGEVYASRYPADDSVNAELAAASGVGIEKGRLGILQYKHQKSLYWGLNKQPLPWAA